MRNLFVVFLAVGFIACGPSAEEKKAAQEEAEATVDEIMEELEEEIDEAEMKDHDHSTEE